MISQALLSIADHREPDFLIGPRDDPYLRRWFIKPRNDGQNVYLHHIRHSDDDRALHDHPYENTSIVLAGGYWEITPEGRFWREPGSITERPAEALHRLEVEPGVDAWSMFITGPRIREWGFACPQGWRVWTEFVSARDAGDVGRGCE